jgi:FkbM family methyltransferase
MIEIEVLDCYKSRKLPVGCTVVDIGAGVGDFALVASGLVGPSGKVVAIEPDEEDYECLLSNIESNHCRNIIPIHTAVSDRDEEVLLSFKGRSRRCRARRLRDVLAELAIDSRSIRFVKIDIEGWERTVVPDNLGILSQCDRVAIELHDGTDVVIHPLMEQLGFFFRRISRQEYMRSTVLFVLNHPVQSLRIYRAARRAEAFHGLGRFLHGLDIASSGNLIVGEYVRREL